jgi:hypothetical protein
LSGTGVEQAAAEQRYHRLAFDAASSWLDGDASPAASFEARLGELLLLLPADTAPIHIFGEVPASLWESGLRSAALGVEAVSNALRATRPVSILCAYRESVLADAADLELACGEHTAVVDLPPFPAPHEHVATEVVSSMVLPPAPASCRQARQLVRAAFPHNGTDTAIDTAELVISELTGNAVRHAGSTFTTEVLTRNGSVRLAVTDAAQLPERWEGFPIAREHGLGLVAALANEWGVQPLAGGKVIWADVSRIGGVGSAPSAARG